MNLVERIQSSLAGLSASERRVAELVLADPRAFASLPVGMLAEKADVSKPTVLRFCRSMGFAGLSDFKLKLAASSAGQGVPFVHRAVGEGDDTATLMRKILDNTASALLRYRDESGSAALETAIDALAQTIKLKGRIEFYGVGNSGIVAQDAQHKFFRLGGNTVAFADGHVQIMAATMLGVRDCAVIISNSGRSRDLLDACEIARRKGARTIAITASGSPLSERADVFIQADHPEGYEQYSPMVSRILHLVIVDILATGVALRMDAGSLRPMLAQIKRNLRRKRYRA